MLVLPYKKRPSLRVASQFAVLTLALAWCSNRASAEDKNVLAAASAFAQGQQAELSGNNAHAAELFELADRIAPTPEALRSATRARLAAGQLPSAAGNAEELLRRYERDALSRELAEQVLTRAKPELTRFSFQCNEPCSVVVDGFATGVQPLAVQVVYVSPGTHEMVIGFAGDLTRSLRLQGAAGETRSIKVAKPAPRIEVASKPEARGPVQASSEPRSRARLSPAYFWVAAGATVATGALALWSGLDLVKARDDFQNDPAPSRAQFNDGESKDRRTSVLIGAASVLAVGTVAIGLFTDFAGTRSERRRASLLGRGHADLALDTQGARLSYGGRF